MIDLVLPKLVFRGVSPLVIESKLKAVVVSRYA